MSTDTPEVRPTPEAPQPPTLDAALAHLDYLDAVDVDTFKEWSQLNPGGVCVLIRALFARLPMSETRPALLATLRAPAGEPVATPALVLADALECFWNAALDVTHPYQDATANAVMGGMVQGFAAMAKRLRESAPPTPPVVSSPPSEAVLDYTDIANRAQEATGRGIHPSTVKAVLEAAGLSPSPAEQGAREELAVVSRHRTKAITERGRFEYALKAIAPDLYETIRAEAYSREYTDDDHNDFAEWVRKLAPLAAGRVGVAEAGREFFREVTDAIAYAPMGHAARDRLTKAAAMFDKALAGPLVAGEVEPTFSQRTLYDDRDAVYKAAERAGPRLYFALLRLLEAVEERRDQCGIESATIRDAHDALAAATVRPLVYADTAKGSP
jgi:hypothetical protein